MKLKRIGRMFGIAMAAVVLFCGNAGMVSAEDMYISYEWREYPSETPASNLPSVKFGDQKIWLDMGGNTSMQHPDDPTLYKTVYVLPAKGGYLVRMQRETELVTLPSDARMDIFYNQTSDDVIWRDKQAVIVINQKTARLTPLSFSAPAGYEIDEVWGRNDRIGICYSVPKDGKRIYRIRTLNRQGGLLSDWPLKEDYERSYSFNSSRFVYSTENEYFATQLSNGKHWKVSGWNAVFLENGWMLEGRGGEVWRLYAPIKSNMGRQFNLK